MAGLAGNILEGNQRSRGAADEVGLRDGRRDLAREGNTTGQPRSTQVPALGMGGRAQTVVGRDQNLSATIR
jgi:hypothetical protein